MRQPSAGLLRNLIAASIVRHHADFRRRGPRLAVDFRKRLELDEAARLRSEGDGFQLLAFCEVALGHRLAEILPVVADVKFIVLDRAVFAVVLPRQIGETFDRRGGVNSMMISCGQGGLASCHCVCQKVFGSPSTAFAPLPFSPAVSSLSALTNFSATFPAGAGVAAGAGAAAGVAGTVPLAVLLDWQPLASSAHTTSAHAPASRESRFVFIAGINLFCITKNFYQVKAASSRSFAATGS